MLSEKIIEQLTERLVNRIEKGNAYVLEQIGHSIKKIGELSPSKAQALEQILKYGGSYEKIVNKLAEITELNAKEIYKIFEEVVKKDYQFAKQFYDYRGIDYIPYEQNKALQNQVKALAKITIGEYLNISRTTSLGFGFKDKNGKFVFKGLQQAYYDVIDEAILSVSQGKATFRQQMFKTIKELGSSGLKVLYPTGYSRRLDSSVRMNIQGGLRDLHNEMQQKFGKEFGSDGVEISVHSNPAPDHAEVQGRQFSDVEYNNLQMFGIAKNYTGKIIDMTTSSKNGNVNHRAISQYNCYHYIFSIVLGVSKPEYSNEQLQKIIDDNNKGFDFDGKHYTNYEGTQLQRKLETEIRKEKDTLDIAKASGNQELVDESKEKIDALTNKYHKLSKVSGLPTKMGRLRTAKYSKIDANIVKTNFDNLSTEVTHNIKLSNVDIEVDKQIPPIKLTDFQIKSSNAVYNAGLKNKMENLAVIDDDGLFIIEHGKNDFEIDYSPEQIKYIFQNDRKYYSIHNHLSENIPNMDDIKKIFKYPGVKGIIVSGDKYHYYIEPSVKDFKLFLKNKDELLKFEKEINDFMYENVDKYDDLLKNSEVNDKQFMAFYEFLTKRGWKYGRIRKNS